MARCSECVHAVREADGHWCAKLNGYSLNGDHEISCGQFTKQEVDIIARIGTPAALEQLAEECCELGQAALKLARFLRGQNPTRKTRRECQDDLREEVADVLLCIELIQRAGIVGSLGHIDEIVTEKHTRWIESLDEVKK